MLRIVLAALVSITAAPSLAYACGCCDGSEVRRVVGWSDRGVRVQVERAAGCMLGQFEEVWRRGVPQPVHCFDRFSETPTRAVACDALQEGNYGDPVADTGRERFFPHPVRWVAPSHLEVHWRKSHDPEAVVAHTGEVAVRYWTGDDWHTIARLSARPRRPGEGDEEPEWQAEERAPTRDESVGTYVSTNFTARVAIPPSGGYGLLLVTAVDREPGIGLFGDTPVMVELPGATPPTVESEDAARVLGVLQPSPTHDAERAAFLAEREAAAASDDEYERLLGQVAPPAEVARHLVRQGLRHHRAGRYREALGRFYLAIQVDPHYAAARFDAACAHARLGEAERAMARLRELADQGCADCQRRLRAAARDRDLASLRDRTDFRALVRL